MENKSYPEILHNICVEFGHGEKSRVEPFEKAIVLLIDQIVTDEKKKLLPIENQLKSEHYLKNENIKSDCESCSRNDIILGCTLKRKNQCLVDEKYTKYRRGYLLPCDRCKTYSVITKIDMISHSNKETIPRPAIKFMCLKCKDYPLINKGTFKGYELRGVEFTEKYLRICKKQELKRQNAEKTEPVQVANIVEQIEPVQPAEQTEFIPTEQQEQQKQIAETTEPVQPVQPVQPEQQAESVQDGQKTELVQATQKTENIPAAQNTEDTPTAEQEEQEIETVAISAD